MIVYIVLDTYDVHNIQVVSAHATYESAIKAVKRMHDTVGGDYDIQEAEVEE